jgi:hypothetical protein
MDERERCYSFILSQTPHETDIIIKTMGHTTVVTQKIAMTKHQKSPHELKATKHWRPSSKSLQIRRTITDDLKTGYFSTIDPITQYQGRPGSVQSIYLDYNWR